MRTSLKRFLGTAMATALTVGTIPMAGAAYNTSVGLGVGLNTNARVRTTNTMSTDANANTNAAATLKLENRCRHLTGADRDDCLRIAKVQVSSRGDATARAEARAAHGKFMSSLRHMGNEARDLVLEIRVFVRDALVRIAAALHTQASVAIEACKGKTGDARRTCLIEAKAKLSTKVDAAINAINN